MDWKNNETSGATEATAPSARAHTAGDGGAVAGQARRFSAQRKLSAVQRLFRGESLDVVSRDLGVPVHRLSEWPDRALAGAEGAHIHQLTTQPPMLSATHPRRDVARGFMDDAHGGWVNNRGR